MQFHQERTPRFAPMIVNEIFESLSRMRNDGIGLLLVEQNVHRAATISNACYVMERGRIVTHGIPSVVLTDEAVRQRLSV
jgi:branched-chain amino acid transport system ATP-binding protein